MTGKSEFAELARLMERYPETFPLMDWIDDEEKEDEATNAIPATSKEWDIIVEALKIAAGK